MVPVLLLASVAVFAIVYLIPGDPAHVLLGPDATPAQLAAVRREMGLDRPLPAQYAIWLGRVLRGDLGKSFINDYPVASLIWLKVPATVQLTLGATAVALLVSLRFGILAALRPASWLDLAISFYNALALAVPTFWLGILLVLLFGLQLKWLPTSGYVAPSEDLPRHLRFLVLPAITLGLGISAVLARFLRSALLEVLAQDYVRTARAKGLSHTVVVGRHALKDALIPAVTALGLQFGAFTGGSVITEAIFDWPGIGRMILAAILSRDYTVVQGTILMVVAAFVVINLLTDVTYAFLDPRIRHAA